MSTPVTADGVVYGLSSRKKGQIVAVDAGTGGGAKGDKFVFTVFFD